MSIMLNNPFYRIIISGAFITDLTLDSDIIINMNTSFEPDSFEVKIYNVDLLTKRLINKGNIISITLGYKTGLFSNIITGIITNISNEDTQSEDVLVINGIDRVIYVLKNKTVNLSINTPNDVVNIIRQIAISAGVPLSPMSIPSGVILQNYTIEGESAYDAIKDLIDRIKYNVTAKNSFLIVTSGLIATSVAALITDDLGYNIRKSDGILQNGENSASGYTIYGAGIPTLIPFSLVNILSLSNAITGIYVVETVIHNYNSKSGYTCTGIVVEQNVSVEDINAIQYPTVKTLSSQISKKINDSILKKRALTTGIINSIDSENRLITAKIGVNFEKIKSIVIPSIEGEIGENNVLVIKKPTSSVFAGDGFGVIVPIYEDMRAVLGFNRFDAQDINVLGFLWKKGWIIPEHDEGEYLIHMKEHSKISMKEDGHGILQFKGLKIEIDEALTEAKTIATDDGKFTIIVGDYSITLDGSDITLTDGTRIIKLTDSTIDIENGSGKINMTSSSIVIEHGSKITINSSGVDVT